MGNGKVIRNSKARRNLNRVAAHLWVFTLLASLAIAQRTTGTLSGQVLDPQGATVPNARISVTDQEIYGSSTVTLQRAIWNKAEFDSGKILGIYTQGFRTLVRRTS
jgi:hypothetical protein